MTEPSRRPSYHRLVAETVGVRVALVALNAGYIVILAGLLGAEGYGLLSIAIATTIVFLTLSFAGTNSRLAVEIGRSAAEDSDIAGAFLVVRYVTAATALCACVAWGLLYHGGETAGWLIALLALAVLPRSVAALYSAILLGRGQAHLSMRCELTARSVEIALVLLGVLLFGLGLFWVVLVNIASWSMQWLWLKRRIGPVSLPNLSRKMVSSVLLKGAPYGVLGAELAWLTQSAMVNAPPDLTPAEALGWIALAVNGLTVVLALLQSVLAPMSPQLARSARDGTSLGSRTLAAGLCAALAVGLFVDASIRLLPPALLVELLGQDYLGLLSIHAHVAWMVAAIFSMMLAASLIGYHEKMWLAASLTFLGIGTVIVLLALLPEQRQPSALLVASAAGATLVSIGLTWLNLALTREDRIGAIKVIALPVLVGVALAGLLAATGDVPLLAEGLAILLLSIAAVRSFPRLT